MNEKKDDRSEVGPTRAHGKEQVSAEGEGPEPPSDTSADGSEPMGNEQSKEDTKESTERVEKGEIESKN